MTPESTVAHYRIAAKLGKGGMGEVWRATDLKLGRQVAIKILPPSLAQDPDRLARFQREAHVLATLNHPHIAAIYDIEKFSGIHGLVMELVEGRSLAEDIGAGPIPWQDAAPVARQIAEALEAAHEKGIIHRDLKPANIKINEDGEVKVLDFGLAKIAEPASHSAELTESPTLTFRATQAGVIMGTAAYMSPEQARGMAVDRRADIWSFGAVLYEMLTGRQAFGGETVTDLLAAVLKTEPDWSALPKDLPPPLVTLLRRCLDKDRKRRLRDIGEARIALEGSLASAVTAAAEPTPDPAPVSRRGHLLPLLALLAGIALGLGIYKLWDRAHPAAAAAPEFRFRPLTRDAGLTTEPAISPDGKFVVYASDRAGNGDLDLWLQQVKAGGLPVRLTQDPADEHEASFSPDGSTIAFRSENDGGSIYTMAAVGGEPRLIVKGGHSPRFSPDGSQIAFWTGGRLSGVARSRIYTVPAAGGQPREIETKLQYNRFPFWTEDGKQVIFIGGDRGAGGGVLWRVIKPDSPGTILTVKGANRVLPSGWWRGLILCEGPGIQAFRLVPGRWEIDGPAIHVTAGSFREEHVSATNSASLAFASLTSTTNIWGLRIDHKTAKPAGDLRRLTRNADFQLTPSVSLDGRQFTFVSTIAGIIVRDSEPGKERVIVSDFSGYPSMSPDGSKIAYNRSILDPKTGKPRFEISVVDVKGGQKEKLCDDCGLAPFWSADGRKILYDVGSPRHVGILDVDQKKDRPLIDGNGRGVYQASFSPDDRWIAFEVEYGADHAGIAVAPFHDGARVEPSQWIPITDGKEFDSRVRWSPGGDRLYFVSDRDGFRCIWTIALDSVAKRASGPATPVFHLHEAQRSILNLQGIANFNLAVSRNQLIFNLGETTGNIWLAEPR